jgi:hypothetical protein
MDDAATYYRIWTDNLSVGDPLELPSLIAAVKSGQVQLGTWLYLDQEKKWVQAGQLAELKLFFKPSAARTSGGRPPGSAPAIKPGSLRRISLFAELEDEQLEVFIGLMETIEFKQFATVVKAGDHGDAMFLVLEGEVRARNMIEGRETTLATIGAGGFFGEVALLDHGPRSADVVANQPSVLLKISAGSVERLIRESPAVAAPFLHALSRAVVGRIRNLLKKYQDTIQFTLIGESVG